MIGFLAFLSCTSTSNKSDGGFKPLFVQGADDWLAEGDADWSYINNELIGQLDSGSGFVMTKTSYKDFVLTVEFNPDSTINSGVFVRCKGKEISASECYEINIWDLHPNQDYRTGSIVTRSSPLNRVETLNKWNTYEIRYENDHIQAWINGIQTADINDNSLSEGYIGLQAAGRGAIKFRNVQIQTLKSGEAK